MRDSRPNILVICTDQQSAETLGNQNLSTPAMDWLLSRGIQFHQAYCTNPICVPSRASLFTGRMPHEVGINYNVENKQIHAPCLGKLMAQAGYETGYIGKWHLPMDHQNVDWHGFHFQEHTASNHVDELIPEACGRFFRLPHKRPFFLVASFVNPHDICEWARIATGIKDELGNGAIPPPPNAAACPPLPENFEIPEDEPDAIRRLQHDPRARRTYPVNEWTNAQWRQYRWAYFRLVELVDRQIGKTLDHLHRSPTKRPTIIIFTSDHGDGMGAHRWNQKSLLYEECTRVPMILIDPEQTEQCGTADDRLVSNGLDLTATILDYAEQHMPDGYQGHSLRTQGPGHDELVCQTELAPVYDQPGFAYGRMLRTSRFKYCRYWPSDPEEQLFDLVADPGEMNNLATAPWYQHILAEHRQLLETWMTQNEDVAFQDFVSRSSDRNKAKSDV